MIIDHRQNDKRKPVSSDKPNQSVLFSHLQKTNFKFINPLVCAIQEVPVIVTKQNPRGSSCLSGLVVALCFWLSFCSSAPPFSGASWVCFLPSYDCATHCSAHLMAPSPCLSPFPFDPTPVRSPGNRCYLPASFHRQVLRPVLRVPCLLSTFNSASMPKYGFSFVPYVFPDVFSLFSTPSVMTNLSPWATFPNSSLACLGQRPECRRKIGT